MKRSGIQAGAKSTTRGSTFAAPRKQLERKSSLERVSSLKSTTDGKGKRSGSISPASKEQREKAQRPCIVTGQSGANVDPAHLWPRGRGGCDDPLCVVPLRRDVHRAFDEGEFDPLGTLIAHGMWAEIAHPILAHGVDPIALLERLTNRRWVPTVVEQQPVEQRDRAGGGVSEFRDMALDAGYRDEEQRAMQEADERAAYEAALEAEYHEHLERQAVVAVAFSMPVHDEPRRAA